MKTKTIKDHGWTPVLKGRIYCSPRCGGGCTKAEHDMAHREANATLRKLKTRGWEVRVWENIGWHWQLTNRLCGMSLSPFHIRKGQLITATRRARKSFTEFGCMMHDGDVKNESAGSMQFSHFKYFKDPNTAVAEMFKEASAWFEAQARGHANLKSIFTKN